LVQARVQGGSRTEDVGLPRFKTMLLCALLGLVPVLTTLFPTDRLLDWAIGEARQGSAVSMPVVQQDSYEATLLKGMTSWRRLDGTQDVVEHQIASYLDDVTTTTMMSIPGLDNDQMAALVAFVVAYFVVVLAACCTTCIAEVAFLFLYGSMSGSRRPFPPQGASEYMSMNDFSVGCFDCCSDMQYCLHGCCCSGCRWADTMQAAGIMDYYPAVLVVVGSSMMISVALQVLQVAVAAATQVTVPLSGLSAPIMGLFFMWFRQKLRVKLNPAAQPFADSGQAAMDCLSYCCCSCCSVIQDAREVDKASGVRVDCCCKLTYLAPPAGSEMPAIGVPVGVGTQGGQIPLTN